MKLLENILVLDFSQFLSGPSASLRLADMGARVIKIERPGTGDICRTLYVSDVDVEGESTIFHAINRNKESFVADLKNQQDLIKIKKLITQADIIIHNFRPGVMERIGLSYNDVKAIKPSIIYGEISGYGYEGEWKDKPGQDLLLQSVSGLAWLSGNKSDGPMPMGVAVADILSSTHLVQGLLAAYYSYLHTGDGALVQISMLESLIDFQFEVLTSYYNDGKQLPQRSGVNNAHAYIAAPYGIYRTADGLLSIAMCSIPKLGELLNCPELLRFTNAEEWYMLRDEIKSIIKKHLLLKTTKEWLRVLEPADVWCSQVFHYDELIEHEAYKVLQMEQELILENGKLKTTRCPIRVDEEILFSSVSAPKLGQHTLAIEREFDLI